VNNRVNKENDIFVSLCKTNRYEHK